MTARVLRVAVLVGAVVVGALVIANAFPTAGTPGPSSSSSSSPSASPSSHPHRPAKVDCSKVQGTQLAVENATSSSGLAAATATKLQAAGYKINPKDIGNAPASSSTTTVYFRSTTDRVAAKCLRRRFFHGSSIQRLPSSSGIAAPVQVAVFIGTDYAAAHPNG